MKDFLKKYSEFTLIALVVIFLVILFVYFFWVTTTMVVNTNKALSVGSSGFEIVGFNLKGAASLDLKGLIK